MSNKLPFPNLHITSIDSSSLDDPTRILRARQLGTFMAGVHEFYMKDLGLRRTDPDAPGTPRDIAWRVGRLREPGSGPIQVHGREIICAFKADRDGKISEEDNAIQGLLVLDKPSGLCTPTEHTPTEIVEWNIAKRIRGQGLGRAMLLHANIHPRDEVILDVAEPNLDAIHIYEHYGLTFDSNTLPQRHGIFDVRHLRMHTEGAVLLGRLGLGS